MILRWRMYEACWSKYYGQAGCGDCVKTKPDDDFGCGVFNGRIRWPIPHGGVVGGGFVNTKFIVDFV